jgi:diguanylate cyclase (GGDEF)-like protein
MPLQGISTGGKHKGMASALLNHLAERLSVEFEHHPTESWSESLRALERGQCDMLPAVPASNTLEQNPDITLTEVYYSLPTVVLGRIETPFFGSITELHGQSIGVSNHTAWVNDLSLQHPGLNLQVHSSEREALQRLQSGDLYGYIGTLVTTSMLLQEMKMNDIRVIGRIPMDTSLAIAVHEQNTVLASILEKALASLSATERAEMERRWLSVKLEERVDYALLWKILLGTLIVFTLLLYWNRKLQRLNRKLEQANHKLAQISTTDQLTGVGNRTHFEQTFEARFEECRNTESPYLVAMVDADHFKRINDQWGHEAGDACLKRLADILKSHFSDFDSEIVRFGGEEFVIFSAITDSALVNKQLEDMRATVEASTTEFEAHLIKLTISIGYCCTIPKSGDMPQQWLRAADRALYDAKDAGRNCVVRRFPYTPKN